jgi:hypothetical protein
MSARDIPIRTWPRFLEQFGREHRAWLATVEREQLGEAGRTQFEAVEQPLARVTPEVRSGRVVGIDIQFLEKLQARPIHIQLPTRVCVEETAEGVSSGVEIDDEDGNRTRIRFHSAPLPEMLDGVAPGELPGF